MAIPATVATIASYVDQEVELQGWLYNKRGSGRIAFLQLRDGTGLIQCIASKKDLEVVEEGLFQRLRKLGQESSLVVRGMVRQDDRAPHCGHEIHVTGAHIVCPASDYPITKKEHGPAFLHDHRHLWFRSKRQQAILRIRHLAIKAIRDYLDSRGYVLFDSPMLTPNACEGTTTLFSTDYYGRPAYLTQSGQLYQEAGALALRKTYCFGPVFRAEKSDTRRHLTEFWMVEPEVAWIDFDGVMDLCEDFLVNVVAQVLEQGRPWLEELERDVSVLERVQKPFPRISYDDAAQAVRDMGIEMEEGDDFGSPQETALANSYDRPVMVHRYPTAVKAFYMKEDPERPERCFGVDVLAPEGYGEIIGGGQREDDLGVLVGKIEQHGLPMDAFEWYLDLRRFGSAPHGGFGLGVERFVAWLCGVPHIRECIPFPRMMERIAP